jgi:MFS family permease
MTRVKGPATAAALVMPPAHRQVRWVILLLLFGVTVINFVDRQTLSVLAPIIRDTFHLSNTQYGTIVSWFQFGMVVGEFPMGWLMDRVGVRLGLAGAVLWRRPDRFGASGCFGSGWGLVSAPTTRGATRSSRSGFRCASARSPSGYSTAPR